MKRSEDRPPKKRKHRRPPKPRPSPSPPPPEKSTPFINSVTHTQIVTTESSTVSKGTSFFPLQTERVAITNPTTTTHNAKGKNAPTTMSIGDSDAQNQGKTRDFHMVAILVGVGSFLGLVLSLSAFIICIWYRKTPKTKQLKDQLKDVASEKSAPPVDPPGYSSHIDSIFYDVPYSPPSSGKSSSGYDDVDRAKISGTMVPMNMTRKQTHAKNVAPPMNSEHIDSLRQKIAEKTPSESRGNYEAPVNTYDHVYTAMMN